MRKAILLGDPVSSGGEIVTATSGLPNVNLMIATVGDMAYCKSCKTKAPIIPLNEVASIMPNGKQIALEGDKVDCRCPVKPTIVATVSTLTVEDNRHFHPSWPTSCGISPRCVVAATVGAEPSDGKSLYNDHYKILDEETNKPLKNVEYAVERPDGTVEYGTTDGEGHTHLLSETMDAEGIKVFLEGQA